MGPLTRSVRDAAVTLNAIAGHDPRDDTSSRAPVGDYLPPSRNASIRGVRIGVPENFYFDRLDPEVEAAVRAMARVAETLGARGGARASARHRRAERRRPRHPAGGSLRADGALPRRAATISAPTCWRCSTRAA